MVREVRNLRNRSLRGGNKETEEEEEEEDSLLVKAIMREQKG